LVARCALRGALQLVRWGQRGHGLMAVESSDTFPKLLLQHASERGDRPAYREKSRGIWRTLTWRDLADEAQALAAALSERGLQRGAHVAFLGDNRPRLYAAMAAAHWLGAIAVPLYPDSTAEEIAGPLKSAGVTHVFAENQEQVDKLIGILPQCPGIRCIVFDKDRGMRHYAQPQLVAYAALVQQGRELMASKGEAVRAEASRGAGQDSAFVFFTSGTTGTAKGAILTHAALIDRARATAKSEGLNDTDVVMAYLPPGWIGQGVFGYVQPMVAGYCVCCPESSDTMLADMREMGPTCFLATPRVLEALLTQVTIRMEDTGGLNLALYRRGIAAAQKGSSQATSLGDKLVSLACRTMIYGPLRDVLGMSRMRAAYSAGDAIAPDLLTFFRTLGVNLKQIYGSTETGVFVAMQRDASVRPDAVGAATEGVELKLSSEQEILVRSPGLFKAYHGDPVTTAQAKTADGWYRTGDIGDLGADGQLRIVDRAAYIGKLKDGTQVAPRLIESRLKFLPYIKEAVAFGGGRDKVCVLVDIDTTAVGRWADKQSISYTGHADLASRDAVCGLVAECIASVNADLARDARLKAPQIHRFAVLQKELTADDGLLTRTGKLRRGVIEARYGLLVEAMYDGRTQLSADAELAPAADLQIRDVKIAQTMGAA
jgi:long-chain acyl-CoA synthetase